MTETGLGLVILAAGKGTRLHSQRAKVLHELNGWPLLRYVLAATAPLPAALRLVVIGHQAAQVRARLADQGLLFVEQREQRGTGHALLQTEPVLKDKKDEIKELLVLPGDLPLLQSAILQKFIEFHRAHGARLSLLTALLDDPTGYGRVVRDERERVVRIVEERDASPEERRIKEINSGIYLIRNDELLWDGLKRLNTENAQGEYYLTDLIAFYVQHGETVRALALRGKEAEMILGVNSRAELAWATGVLRRRKLQEVLASGVSIENPEATVVEQDVVIEQDSLLRPGSRLRGRTRVGADCIIESAILHNTQIGTGARIYNAQLESYTVGPGVTIKFSLLQGPEGKEGA